jgi:hypothetical protein
MQPDMLSSMISTTDPGRDAFCNRRQAAGQTWSTSRMRDQAQRMTHLPECRADH